MNLAEKFNKDHADESKALQLARRKKIKKTLILGSSIGIIIGILLYVLMISFFPPGNIKDLLDWHFMVGITLGSCIIGFAIAATRLGEPKEYDVLNEKAKVFMQVTVFPELLQSLRESFHIPGNLESILRSKMNDQEFWIGKDGTLIASMFFSPEEILISDQRSVGYHLLSWQCDGNGFAIEKSPVEGISTEYIPHNTSN